VPILRNGIEWEDSRIIVAITGVSTVKYLSKLYLIWKNNVRPTKGKALQNPYR
jgi:hypothetical protein